MHPDADVSAALDAYLAQVELYDHSFKLEALRTHLVSKKFLSDKEFRAQALAEVERAHQKDIQYLKDQIKSLAERD